MRPLNKGNAVTARWRPEFEETGATFSEFVAQARLDRARELLLDPTANGAKISDIAQRVGYGEITTFNRAFRRRFGDTPSGLRRQ